ncbi:MAG: TIGR00282 family metallophosphoesterase [Patescibacteria group bacterium]
MLKILFFGDIMGRIGRQAAILALEKWEKPYKPDLVIANAENLAHGKGVTRGTLREMLDAGFHFFTSGNHVWDKPEVYEIFEDPNAPLIRPANYPQGIPGDGFRILEVGKNKVMIINLNGRISFRENFDCPFRTIDFLLDNKPADVKTVLVDFHVEATSEAKSLGHYLRNRASAVWGTHTHVGTVDYEVLNNKMAYVTQVGMVGAKNSSLGVAFDGVIENFLTQLPTAHEIPEKGLAEVNAIYLEINDSGAAKKIKKLYDEVEIK